jgi:hypothetical protein
MIYKAVTNCLCIKLPIYIGLEPLYKVGIAPPVMAAHGFHRAWYSPPVVPMIGIGPVKEPGASGRHLGGLVGDKSVKAAHIWKTFSPAKKAK